MYTFLGDTGILNFAVLNIKIMKVRKIEEEIAKNTARKIVKFKNLVKIECSAALMVCLKYHKMLDSH